MEIVENENFAARAPPHMLAENLDLDLNYKYKLYLTFS